MEKEQVRAESSRAAGLEMEHSDSECTGSDSGSRAAERRCFAGRHYKQVRLTTGEVYEGTVLDEFASSVDSGSSDSEDEATLVLDGVGKLVHPDGSLYKGEFHNGKKHGYGITYMWNGDKHVGEYRDGKFNGVGTFSGCSSSQVDAWGMPIPEKHIYYVGDFVDGRFHGAGTLKETDLQTGEVFKFEGEFENGERSGSSEESIARARTKNAYVQRVTYRTQSYFIPVERPPSSSNVTPERDSNDFDRVIALGTLSRTKSNPRNVLVQNRTSSRFALKNLNDAVNIIVPFRRLHTKSRSASLV
uniref:MORN repeat-containing protein 5 n=1 Tax=Compsopogon caeruleus TaxID=31354 RepID=A0A7S1TDC9_9RHOD|mmetsp:Transcript_1507/g.2952  ORF Transcript_1507/g.2952 Transcript_1507/m.2952 type:complete len:302 (+) Transcript_1507:80-985(+)